MRTPVRGMSWPVRARRKPLGSTEAPPPGYGRAWDEQAPDWAYAGRPAPNWQPRPYDGYADGSEPNSYIGTFSADRFGYRTFRYTP